MSSATSSGGLDVIYRPAFGETQINLNVAPQPDGTMGRWSQRQPLSPLLNHCSRRPPFLSAGEQYQMIHQPAMQARFDTWPNDLWKQWITTNRVEVFVCLQFCQARPVDVLSSWNFIAFFTQNRF